MKRLHSIAVLCYCCFTFSAQEKPQLDTLRLVNGIKAYYLQGSEDSVVAIRVLMEAGKISEDPCEVGYSILILRLLEENVASRLKLASVKNTAVAGRIVEGKTRLDIQCPYRYLTKAIDVLSTSLRSLPFDKTKLEKIVSSVIDAHTLENLDGESLSELFRPLVLFGKNVPAGRAYCQYQLEKVTVFELREFYLRHYQPKACSIIFFGKYALKPLGKLTKKYFTKWKAAKTAETVKPQQNKQEPEIRETAISMVNLLAAEDYHLSWMLASPPTGSPDHLPFLVYSRLFLDKFPYHLEIREETQGFITFVCRVERAEVRDCLRSFDSALRVFRHQPPEPARLLESAQAMKYRYPRSERAAELLSFYDPLRYDFSSRLNYLACLSNLRPEIFESMRNRYFQPGQYQLVIVGKEHLIREDLKSYKAVKHYESMDFETCDVACKEIIIVKCHCETCRLKGRCYVWRFNPKQKEAIKRAQARQE